MNQNQKMSLHDMRKESELVATEIAFRVGVSYQTLRNWEKGISIPDAVQMKKLLDVYEKTNDDLDWVIFEKEKKK